MATEISAPLPNLQSVQKAMALPTVEAAVGQVGAIYSKVKGAHSLLEWALSTAEAGVAMAATTAAPYVATPIAGADLRLAAALDELGKRVPIINEPPKVIVESTKQAVLAKVSPHVNKVCAARAVAGQRVKSLKDLSWAKANVLLSSAYGQKAMNGVDTGAYYAMQLLNKYLPPVDKQEEPATEEIVAATADPALHTAQTVGRLSAVAARRVWSNLSYRVHELRKSGIELDPRRYLAALIAAIQLAQATRQAQEQERSPVEPQPTPIQEPQPNSLNKLDLNQSQSPPLNSEPEVQNSRTESSPKTEAPRKRSPKNPATD